MAGRWRTRMRDALLFAALAESPALLAQCAAAPAPSSASTAGGGAAAAAGSADGTAATLDASSEPLAGLLRAASKAEDECWVTSAPDAYPARLGESIRALVGGAVDVAWLSLEPRQGSTVDFYPKSIAGEIEAAYLKLLGEMRGGKEETRLASLQLGERFFNATINITAASSPASPASPISPSAADLTDSAATAAAAAASSDPGGAELPTCFMFQTTPSGGHRSVLRWAVPREAAAPAWPMTVELTVVRTGAGEWRFALPSLANEEGAEERVIAVEVPETHLVFSMPRA